jgi:light-regulated signal transduction histidine kinase (bacteriophytochrome)
MEKINAKKDATMEILSHDLKGPISIIHSFA